jgi:hypothetical protein
MSWVKAVCKYDKLPQKTATRLMHDYKRTNDASESQRWQVNTEGWLRERISLFELSITPPSGDNLAVWIIDLHTEGFLDGSLKTTLAAKGIP